MRMKHAHFSCVQFPLLLLSITAQHSALYTKAGFIAVLYILSFNVVGRPIGPDVPVAHHASCFPPF